MAIYRKLHTTFWDDPFIEELQPDEKYFYIFLLSNPKSSECGIYEISKKKMSDWTGYKLEKIEELLAKFTSYNKLKYNPETFEVALLNRGKYLTQSGKPIIDCIISELDQIKDRSLIDEVLKGVKRADLKEIYEACTERDTNRPTHRPTSRGEQEQEQEEEQEQEQEQEEEHTGNSRDDTHSKKQESRDSKISENDLIEFNRFWDLYDKKRSRKKCLKKWLKLTAAEKSKIFQTLPAYIKSTTDKQYRKDPITYLNNECWDDEIIEDKPKNNFSLSLDNFLVEENSNVN